MVPNCSSVRPVSAAAKAASEPAAVSSPRPSAPAQIIARSFTMSRCLQSPDRRLHTAFVRRSLSVFLGVVQNVVSFQPLRAAFGEGLERPLGLLGGKLLVALHRCSFCCRQLRQSEIAKPRPRL